MHTPEAVAVVILRGCSRSISYRLSSQFKKEKKKKRKPTDHYEEKVFGIYFLNFRPMLTVAVCGRVFKIRLKST